MLVDDDQHVLNSMADWLREQGYPTDTATSKAEAIAAIDQKAHELVLADIRLGDGDGFDLLTHCRATRPDTAVIMITGYGTVESAVEAIRLGAFDFLTKPLIDDELLMAIGRALSQQKVLEENKSLKAQLDLRFGMENVVGNDHRMLKIYDMIDSVADTKATVLITGESGTGKSMIARAIHRRSGRRDEPFVEIACGALPETLLESELFGHVAGAFTGANGDKLGKFIHLRLREIGLEEMTTHEIHNVIDQHKGEAQVILHVLTKDSKEVIMTLSEDNRVKVTEDLLMQLESIVGEENIWLSWKK